MARFRRARWLQLATALWLLGAIGAFYAHVTRALPVPRVTLHTDYSPSIILFSPDSKMLVTAGKRAVPSESTEATRLKDGIAAGSWIDIWDAETGAQRCSMNERGINLEIELSPDNQLLLAKHASSHMTLWDTATGEQLARLRPEADPPWFDLCHSRFSPDGRFILMPPTDGDDGSGKVVFWEVATRQERARIDGRLGPFEQWKFAADGKSFTVCRYAAKSQHLVQRWEIADKAGPRLSLERRVDADSVTVSPDLETFITERSPESSAGCDLQFWDLSTGREKTRSFHLPTTRHVSFLKYSHSGRFVSGLVDFVTSKWVVWDTSNGLEEIGAFSAAPGLSPRERWILTSPMNDSEVWDASGRGKQVTAHRSNDSASFVECHGGQCWSSARAHFSSDDRWLVTSGISAKIAINPVKAVLTGRWNSINGSDSYTVCRLWDVERREEIATFPNCCSAEFSPDGRTLVIEDNKGQIRLYAVPPSRPLGLPLALTVATWGLALLIGWRVQSRLRRSRRASPAVALGRDERFLPQANSHCCQ